MPPPTTSSRGTPTTSRRGRTQRPLEPLPTIGEQEPTEPEERRPVPTPVETRGRRMRRGRSSEIQTGGAPA
eukprot:6328036-Prorocentrum_lima.AAC.1